MENKKAVRIIVIDEEVNKIIEDVLNQKLYKNGSDYISHLIIEDVKPRG